LSRAKRERHRSLWKMSNVQFGWTGCTIAFARRRRCDSAIVQWGSNKNTQSLLLTVDSLLPNQLINRILVAQDSAPCRGSLACIRRNKKKNFNITRFVAGLVPTGLGLRQWLRLTLAHVAAVGTDLLVLGLGVVPMARRSHTTGPGRAPMHPARVNSLGRGTCAQTVDGSAWRSQHPLERMRKLRQASFILQFGWTLALFI
jgi:hypothetical protein